MTRQSFLILFLLMPVAFAFGFELKNATEVSPTALLKWDTSKGAVPITLNSAGSADLPISSVEAALNGALNNWQFVPGQNARFQYAGQSASAVVNNTDQINSVVWIEQSWVYPNTMLAVTRYSYYISDPAYIVDADIQMNGRDYTWGTNLTENKSKVDTQQVLMHEVGHLLGFSHTSVSAASLYPYLPSKVSRSLNVDDKTGMQYLYGAPVSDLRAITPVADATYVEGMSSKGLPLPVFRWGRGAGSSYTLEFSGTSTFAKKITIGTATNNFYALTGPHESKLIKLAGSGKKLYWRVISGSIKSTARLMKFKQM